MPPYQRCGDIVWVLKRQTRTFAFQCIYCQDSRTGTFKDFKRHLESQHPELFHDDQVQDIKPVLRHGTRNLRSGAAAGDQEAVVITPKEEEDLFHHDEVEDIKPLLRSGNQEAVITPKEEQEEEEDPLDTREDFLPAEQQNDQDFQEEEEWPESDNQSFTSEQSTAAPAANTPPFWLLEQHPIMMAFIDQLEQQPLLWDPGMLSYRNYRHRSKACDKIAAGLNNQFGLELASQEIASYVKQLRETYCKENLRLEGSGATPKWFYERLAFLAKSLPRPRTQTMRVKGAELLAVPHLNHAQNLQLIELYRQCHAHWDMLDIACRVPQVRQAARDRLLELCRSEMQITLEPSQLQRYIRQLRNVYHQEKVRRLKSEQQGKRFKSRSRYYEKLSFLEQHMPPFRCDLCSEQVNSVDGFRMHRAKHDDRLPFECPTCGKGFSKVANVTTHLRRHTQDYHLSCEECGKRFATSTDLVVHRRSHTGERPYCCHICGSRFSTVSFFKRHKRRHEQQIVAKCHICGKGFFERSTLRDHIKGHLNVRDKECDVCHKRFTSAKYLNRHKEIHAEHKKYSCKICGKGFAQYAGVRGHMKSHERMKRKGEEQVELEVHQMMMGADGK
nr:zinc finger protein 35-like [Drosophila takahashii]